MCFYATQKEIKKLLGLGKTESCNREADISPDLTISKASVEKAHDLAGAASTATIDMFTQCESKSLMEKSSRTKKGEQHCGDPSDNQQSESKGREKQTGSRGSGVLTCNKPGNPGLSAIAELPNGSVALSSKQVRLPICFCFYRSAMHWPLVPFTHLLIISAMLYAPQAIETIVKELGHIEPALVRVEQSVALGGLMTRLDEVSTVLDISTEGIWPTPFHIKRCLCARLLTNVSHGRAGMCV